jgi:hypothetical protein
MKRTYVEYITKKTYLHTYRVELEDSIKIVIENFREGLKIIFLLF